MPSSTSSSEIARRLPWGLLLGLVLFGAGEQALWSRGRALDRIARYTPPGPDGDPLLVAAALRSLPAPRPDGPAPLLLLGSSQVREGLDCAAFEAREPGRPCVNLAISAGSPLDVLAIADAFDARLPRRAVILGLFPKLMHMPPKAGFVGPSTLGCVFAGGSWRRLAWGDWVALGGGLLERAVPTLRFKDGLAAAWDVVREDPRAAWRLELPPQPRRLLLGLPPQPPGYFARREGVLDADAPHPGAFTAAQEQALEVLIGREAERGNSVYVIDFPTRPGYETTLPTETLAHWRALLERLRTRRAPGLAFIAAGELGPLERRDFQDFTHLSDAGRATVSARLATRVAGRAGIHNP